MEVKMKEVFDEEYIKNKFETREYTIVELCIMKALYKYVLLDKKTLALAVNLQLKPRLQKPHYERNIQAMLGKAILKGKCQMQSEHMSIQSERTIYYLTIAAYNFMRAGYKHMQVTQRVPEGVTDILKKYGEGQIRERIAINKWHLNILTEYDYKTDIYYSKSRLFLKKVLLPSHIKIGQKRETTSIIAVAYPRETETSKKNTALQKMMKTLSELDNALKYMDKANVIVVVLCESILQMEEAYKAVSRIEQSAKLLYVLDADVAAGVGMKRLYACTAEGDTIKKKYYTYVPDKYA